MAKSHRPFKLGIVTARFNTEITSELRAGAHRVAEKHIQAGNKIEVWSVEVPGAIEIPLAAQMLLEKGCAGVVALGAVIRGETPHFEYVNQSVERALTKLILNYQRPIGFGVLTVENWKQAVERIGGKHGHKGEEAAEAVLEMIWLAEDLKSATIPQDMAAYQGGVVPGAARAKRRMKAKNPKQTKQTKQNQKTK